MVLILKICIALLFILVCATFFSKIAIAIKQPAVVGELLAGILLSTCCLGYFFPLVYTTIFTSDTLFWIRYIGKIVLVLYMLQAGTKINFEEYYRQRVSNTLWMAIFILCVNFLGGFTMGYLINPLFDFDLSSRISLAIVCGILFCVTALPVLIRILSDRKIIHTQYAQQVISIAAISDIVVGVLLALFCMYKQGVDSRILFFSRFLFLFLFLFFLFRYVRTLFLFFEQKLSKELCLLFTVSFILLLFYVASLVSLNVAIVAFLLGILLPSTNPLVLYLTSLHALNFVSLLLPLFFASVCIQLPLWDTPHSHVLLIFLVVLFCWFLCKYVLSSILLTYYKMPSNTAWNMGSLLNAGGVMGIYLTTLFYEKGFINSTFHMIFLASSLLSTIAINPLWNRKVIK